MLNLHPVNGTDFQFSARAALREPAIIVHVAGSAFAPREAMALKRFVYILKSVAEPPRYYIGVTSNVANCVDEHNRGMCRHTASGRPWKIDVCIGFSDEQRATLFERYLKTGSGFAFARRHFR